MSHLYRWGIALITHTRRELEQAHLRRVEVRQRAVRLGRRARERRLQDLEQVAVRDEADGRAAVRALEAGDRRLHSKRVKCLHAHGALKLECHRSRARLFAPSYA